MFNILLVSHGNLSKEFLNTCELITGKQKDIEAISLYEGESREDFGKKVLDAAERLYTEDGLLVLADLYGGTPCNMSVIELLNKYEKVEILSGLNLSMLLEVALNRSNLQESVNSIISSGKEGIIDVKKVMASQSDDE